MHDPHDPEARTQIDAAETTLKDVLRKSPESRLALWDLAAIYAMEGRAQDSQKTLAILLHNDPNDSDALTASGTIAAMQIHFDIQAEKRKRNIRLENAARIGDDGIRESLRSEFEPQIQTAVNLLNRAIQNNTQSSQPLVMLNLLYRMEAELAKTDQESQALLRKADALVNQVMAMNQQQEQHRTTAQKKLSPLEPPPPLPGPPPPPPPPPKPPGS
jgi:tetratricopeptide (TPR) repeat protein